MTVLVKRFASNVLSEHWNELVSRGRIESIFNRLQMGCVCSICFHHSSAGHDGTALWAIIGSVSNSALSVFLKRLLNQARPATTSRTDSGMPSSHAQSISFISVYGMAWNQRSLSVPNHAHPRIGFIFYTVKVSQKLHTGNQVVVGGFCFLHLLVQNVELASS
ncbi:hypothetical protein F2Q70_00040681 [Brassica cretica]|uniref:Phosphatidic acid phosphatase type 2/haloperoxidase domain-containing protein n=1 Tax=Brassica cretica TaxID=69181 RepID=A0A3N6QMZ4_BRACR|nr:hypothetical protein F2Q70_00040681 [Brassica cretica]KAF3497435.1 hypothetical protein DY000_02055815 [Brassica cretica]